MPHDIRMQIKCVTQSVNIGWNNQVSALIVEKKSYTTNVWNLSCKGMKSTVPVEGFDREFSFRVEVRQAGTVRPGTL